MKTEKNHPTSEQLKRYGLGKVSEDEAEAVEAHLHACEACSATLVNVASDTVDDTFIKVVRDVGSSFGGLISGQPSGPTPKRIADFEIVSEIARGGMGIVYEAVQQNIGRHVALKVLHSSALVDAQQATRFEIEARAAGQLSHENIVPIFQVGSEKGNLFYAMQLVHGGTVGTLIRELRDAQQQSYESAETDTRSTLAQSVFGSNPSSALLSQSDFFRQVAKIGMQAASALHHAHESGIVHRDVKPSNLLVGYDGKVWVADFGLARIGINEDITRTGDVLGTARYMSPEQVCGKIVDQRSDIYSLGATLYELLTLSPATDGATNIEILAAKTSEEVLRPCAHNASIPRELETVLLKALEKEPNDRYPSAMALKTDLELFLDNRPVLALRPTVFHRARKWARRNSAVVSTLVFSGFAFLLALLFISLLMVQQIQQSEKTSLRRLYDSNVQRALLEMRTNSPGRRTTSLAACREAADLVPELVDYGPDDQWQLRNATIAALTIPIEIRESFAWELPCTQYLVSVDDAFENCAIYNKNNRRIEVRRFEDGSLIEQLPNGETNAEYRRLSSSSRFIAYIEEESPIAKLRVWDRQQKRRVLEDVPAQAHAPTFSRFSPDEKLIWVSRPQTKEQPGAALVAYELPSGKHAKTIELSKYAIPSKTDKNHAPQWYYDISKDGRKIAVSHSRQIVVINQESGKSTSFPITSLQHQPMDFSHDGRAIASVTNDRRGHIWNAISGKETALLAGEYIRDSILFDPYSRILTTGGRGGQTIFWNAYSGRKFCQMPGNARKFNADGSNVAWNSTRKTGSWNIDYSDCFQVFNAPGSGEIFSTCEIGDDLIVAGCDDGVRIWCRHTSRLLSEVPSLHRAYVAYSDVNQCLVTNSYRGLQVWPVKLQKNRVIVGPAKTLYHANSKYADLTIANDGNTIVAYVGKTVVVDLAKRELIGELPTHRACRFYSASSDGRFATTGTWFSNGQHRGLQVWDLETCELATLLHDQPGNVAGAFSPDGNKLIMATDTAYAAFDSRTWEPIWEIPTDGVTDAPGPIAFVSDCVTVRKNESSIQLVRLDDGVAVAELNDPHKLTTVHAMTTSDGHSLVEPIQNRVRMWNITRLRQRLADYGLDWAPKAPNQPPRKKQTVTSVIFLADH